MKNQHTCKEMRTAIQDSNVRRHIAELREDKFSDFSVFYDASNNRWRYKSPYNDMEVATCPFCDSVLPVYANESAD